MKRVSILIWSFSILAIGIHAWAGEAVEKYWERACGVAATGDNVRSMAVWDAGDLLATIDRQSGPEAIRLFNATTGLMEEIVETLDMTGVPSGVNSVCSGDFSDDGAFFACSLSSQTGEDLEVYYWADVAATPVKILDQAFVARLGDALDVKGAVGDRSVTILIGGNSAASQPVRITYNGSIWTATPLAHAVRAQDIDQVSSGQFYATYAGGDIVRYNADGTVDATVVPGAAEQTSLAVDETRGLIYSMGYASGSVTSNVLKVYEIATGNLLADLSADPLDANGFASDPANGSSAVEIVEDASGTYLFALSENNGCARYSYSTVLTVGPSGDYPTVQGAIGSYCYTGGTQTNAVKPLVIAIDPAGGPYDEAVSLMQSATGYGDIAGDLVLKSMGPGKAIVQLQEGDVAGDDGLPIFQDAANVILKDLILCPSQTNPFTDDMLVMMESNANSVENWLEFHGCIITDIDTTGAPMIVSPANALAEPAASGSAMVDGDTLFRFGVDAPGFNSRSLFMEQSVIHASRHLNYIYAGGVTGSQVRLHNTIISHSRAAGIFAKSFDAPHPYMITGDDQTKGILTGDRINCSAIYEFNRRLFYDYAAGIHTRNSENKIVLVVRNTIIATTQNHSQSRGISSWATSDKPASPLGINTDLYKIHDVIIDVPVQAIMDDVSNSAATPLDIRRVTIKTPTQGVWLTDNSTGTATITDSIFVGCAAAVYKPSEPVANVILSHCGLPSAGSAAIVDAASGSVNPTIVHPIVADPLFATTNVLSPAGFDVRAREYQNAASDGSNLCGGANYAFGTLSALEPFTWENYR